MEKYPVKYIQCSMCEFIQTEKPYWLDEAYASAITSIDVGLVFRNVHFSNTMPSILDSFSNMNDAYLDYGGGYGMFVRMMRDKGYNFYLQDKYAENLFAKRFTINDFPGSEKFMALTAFEVFEHLENPMDELHKMFALSDTLIFSTELQPQNNFKDSSEWWYFMPETGQHISFYSLKALEFIANRFDCKLYSNGTNLHLLTKQHLKANPFISANSVKYKQSLFTKIKHKLFTAPEPAINTRLSLLPKDFELYKSYAFQKN